MTHKSAIVLLISLSLVLLFASSSCVAATTTKPFGGFSGFPFRQAPGDPNYGGTKCAGCTIVVSLLEQLTEIRNQPIDKLLDEVCTWFPKEFQPTCKWVVNTYGEAVIKMIINKETPDDICNALPDMCLNKECRLFPPPKATATRSTNNAEEYTTQVNEMRTNNIMKQKQFAIMNNINVDEPWDWIKALLERFANIHDPDEDLDGDKYSMQETMRGWSWRGRDCNDVDKTVYPGARGSLSNTADYNCNGITGKDPKTGRTYKDLFCSNSSQMGIVVVGDSVGAHFSVPPAYLTASEIGNGTYSDLLYVLLNEFDWPERSATTGFENSTKDYQVESLYLNLRQRNLCNHRDYQNLGVNGARVGDINSTNIRALARRPSDEPVILLYEAVGNDVCNGHHDLGRMTTPEQFYIDVQAALLFLDSVLPKGSHVVVTGLVDGRILWDTLHNRTHPIGVSYESVYNYLNCLYISPCWVWLNENETIRDAGSTRAAQLSQVYSQVIGNNTFKNFDIQYYPFPMNAIIDQWVKDGGQAWQLIEPIDGFHPNQISNVLWAKYFWTSLQQDHPDWLGPINPYNAQIVQMFGDQGGY
eukprot:TRINITY_DN67_c0_g1_i2.p1 TRINITY_DN67_c0_g1~~TRINITY_DN67_c0_g1_i2.p1  ORF type:complete len:586 (+),score=98.87 TRINITY_DN67_c0_g1_i2:57-1814(+)